MLMVYLKIWENLEEQLKNKENFSEGFEAIATFDKEPSN